MAGKGMKWAKIHREDRYNRYLVHEISNIHLHPSIETMKTEPTMRQRLSCAQAAEKLKADLRAKGKLRE